ncbi:MAG: DUF2490 domain-containing protein [Flavobacteriaceae bacterium]|nr:DUF2490 domain-containing protein [Flavobacteriaceae bacterium]MDZ4148267.1 DUF2490 domain-containing protein [Flavobacteriaceae bacterium]
MKRTITIALILWANIIFAQETGEDKLGSWFLLSVKNQVSDNLSISTILQKRFHEFLDNGQSVFVSLALNYKLSDKVTLTEGFGYLENQPFLKPIDFVTTFDRRIFEQLTYNDKVDRLQISQRFRAEHRWLSKSGNTDFESRFRYQLWFRYPLNHKSITPNTIYLSSFDEIIFNFQGDAFGQNRLFGGMGYQLDKNIRFEGGYMKNQFRGRNFDRIWLMLFINTDLRNIFKKNTNSHS